VTSARARQTSNMYRRQRTDSEIINPPCYNIASHHRSQLSSRSFHQNYPISLPSRSTSSSSLSNRRSTLSEVAPSISSSNNRPTNSNSSSSTNQTDDSTRGGVSVQSKRYPIDSINPSNKSSINSHNDSTKLSNHLVIIPKSKSNQSLDKPHHLSCPVSYQNQINLGTITILSDSSSDNTILHHLPEHNETTDKSQQSLHDERLHHSPRKPNNNVINSRLHSTSSIDEQKKLRIPSIHYTIEPIAVNEDVNDENHFDSKQKAIREEQKRKADENEQVLINVDEYASEILMYLKEREVENVFIIYPIIIFIP
jgi:hypothetical protein